MRVKNCTMCGEHIPQHTYIDGKKLFLVSRKNCIKCVPYKYKNGKGKQYSAWSEEKKEEHRTKQAMKGILRKRELIKINGGECSVCGYNKCEKALHFHHKSPEEKKFSLDTRTISTKNWELILKEAKKCLLVCANCHSEIHAKKFENLYNKELKYRIPVLDKFCLDCNKKIYYTAIRCDVCSKIALRKVVRPTYEKLKEDLSIMNYCEVGRKYEVSDNTIRKWIKYYLK